METVEPSVTELNDWVLHEYPCVDSTNPIAGKLPGWHAVRAERQVAGRGRTGRNWVSDQGGLWLSAVLPAPGPRAKWAILPLAAGWAVINALEKLGVSGLRLRWPNDVLLGKRKLAGLLVEQYRPELAVVGIGVNVNNRPSEHDAQLVGRSISLSEIIGSPVRLEQIASVVLGALREAQEIIDADRFPEIVRLINAHWDPQREAELTFNNSDAPLRSRLLGVDGAGRLNVELPGGERRLLEASDVALLRELD
jgi:BirA family transcriptional regulator, biotin operon repressor / biotin---[acetyl-CoA-carboxylase] ligase